MSLIFKVQQRGAALITSLIILVVISTLGIAIGKQVISLRKNSSSHYDQTISFANAESAFWEAEAVIAENAYTSVALATYVEVANANNTWWHNDDNWVSASVVTQNGTAIQGEPTYMIEDMGVGFDGGNMGEANKRKRRILKITAKANGMGDAVSYMQSYYAIRE